MLTTEIHAHATFAQHAPHRALLVSGDIHSDRQLVYRDSDGRLWVVPNALYNQPLSVHLERAVEHVKQTEGRIWTLRTFDAGIMDPSGWRGSDRADQLEAGLVPAKAVIEWMQTLVASGLGRAAVHGI